MHLYFKKVSLLNDSFGDIEFYYFSVDQLWYSGVKWDSYLITIVKDVYQLSQSIEKKFLFYLNFFLICIIYIIFIGMINLI